MAAFSILIGSRSARSSQESHGPGGMVPTTQCARYSRSAAADDAKCKIAIKGTSPTAKACAKGGRKEAHKVMKSMVTAAKEKGTKFVCVDCHQDTVNYPLTSSAVEDYKKLQAASGIK